MLFFVVVILLFICWLFSCLLFEYLLLLGLFVDFCHGLVAPVRFSNIVFIGLIDLSRFLLDRLVRLYGLIAQFA